MENNTPDTEWEKEFNKDFGVFNWNETARERHTGEILSCVREVFPCEGGYCDMDVSSIKEFISNLLTSRDTYWKERVEEARMEAYHKVCLVRGSIRDPQLFIDTEMFVEALTPITNNR